MCIGDGNLATAYEAYKGTFVLPNLVNELDNIVEVVSQPGEVVEVSAASGNRRLSHLPPRLTSLWSLLAGTMFVWEIFMAMEPRSTLSMQQCNSQRKCAGLPRLFP